MACTRTCSSRPTGELVPSLDPTRKLARLVLEDAPVVPLGPGGNQAGLWQRVQDDIGIVLAAETVGAADRALADAIAYTSERVVFDKPVATYQTVRHRLVEMFQQVEMARAGFQFAAWASDTESPEREQAAAMASPTRPTPGCGSPATTSSCTVAWVSPGPTTPTSSSSG